MMTKPKISFCTTCMGRLEHIKETFLKNIIDNQDYVSSGGKLEFVLLNYGAELETELWVKKNLSEYIVQGIVVYASFPNVKYFHMSHAKNMAHRLATGDIVCNVDADNFTGQGFATFISKRMANRRSSLRRNKLIKIFSNEKIIEGDAGRIVLFKKDFEILGGYCEKFNGWGGEDIDISTRLIRLHKKIPKHIPIKYLRNITHDDDMRLRNYQSDHIEIGKAARESFEHTELKLKIIYFFIRRKRELFTFFSGYNVNQDGHFGCGHVYINFSNTPTAIL